MINIEQDKPLFFLCTIPKHGIGTYFFMVPFSIRPLAPCSMHTAHAIIIADHRLRHSNAFTLFWFIKLSTMRVFNITLLAVVTTLSVSAFQFGFPLVYIAAPRDRSSSVVLTGQADDNTESSLDRRAFFLSTAQKSVAASLVLTSTSGVAIASDSFPKIYKPTPHSMDDKLGKKSYS